MALIMFGGGIADARGSIGGNTISRSAAGATMRTRRIPITRRTNGQQLARTRASHVSARWSSDLTQTQRDGWATHAASVPHTNKLGQSITLTGFQEYVRVNTLLLLADLAIQDDAPTELGAATAPVTTFTCNATDQEYAIAEPTLGFDPDTDDDRLLIFGFLPQRPGQTKAPTGRRFAAVIVGDSVSAPTFPTTTPVEYPVAEGQLQRVELVHIDPYGRVSVGSVIEATVAAS